MAGGFSDCLASARGRLYNVTLLYKCTSLKTSDVSAHHCSTSYFQTLTRRARLFKVAEELEALAGDLGLKPFERKRLLGAPRKRDALGKPVRDPWPVASLLPFVS